MAPIGAKLCHNAFQTISKNVFRRQNKESVKTARQKYFVVRFLWKTDSKSYARYLHIEKRSEHKQTKKKHMIAEPQKHAERYELEVEAD